MPQSIAAVDLFCGVGGLSLGLTQAGIDVRLGVDIDPACQYPFENNNSARFLLKDVRQLTGSEIISAWAGAKYRVIAGCAPCQPFSHYSCGRRYDRSEDWNLLNEFSRLTKESLPDVVTMENVPKLTRHPIFTQFVADLKQLGYTVNYKRVECSQYGVPQTRKRLVLLASRFGQMTLLPGAYAEKSFVTVRQVIAHLPTIAAGEVCPEDPLHQAKKLSAKNLQRIRNSQPGGTWRDWNTDLRADCHMKKTGRSYPSVYGRMVWDKPAPTLTTQCCAFGSGRFGHPEQDRAISLREAALLQTFPHDYAFFSPETPASCTVISKLIGNAVPVKLAAAVGQSIVAHLQQYGSS